MAQFSGSTERVIGAAALGCEVSNEYLGVACDLWASAGFWENEPNFGRAGAVLSRSAGPGR